MKETTITFLFRLLFIISIMFILWDLRILKEHNIKYENIGNRHEERILKQIDIKMNEFRMQIMTAQMLRENFNLEEINDSLGH